MPPYPVNRPRILQVGIIVLFAVLVACASAFLDAKQDRPNILWIVTEDMSPYLGCYGDDYAETPVLDKLAEGGIVYTRAYANAPVCSAARSTLITGMYGPSTGMHHHRSRVNLPESIRFYPSYLKEAGYYCTNNSKEDYNAPKPKGTWDVSSRKGHFKHAPEGQPFFSIYNLGSTHEACLHKRFEPLKHDPEAFELPPYHPDIPEIRNDWAQFYDRITLMDSQVGSILKELDESGKRDDTIIFFYSDHGGVLARSKRVLYETGTQVAFIAWFPEKYQHLAPASAGTSLDRLVSFVDFPSTLLSLAGVEVPEQFEGHAFMGEQAVEAQEYAYFFRSRMDARYDQMRAVVSKKYKYIRNFYPTYPLGLYLDYQWKAPSTSEWEQAFLRGECNEVQSAYWKPKPAEELYDLENDPWEVNNLAALPEYAEILKTHREKLFEWMIDIRDAALMPEHEMLLQQGEESVMAYTKSDAYPVEEILHVADGASRELFDDSEILKYLQSDNATIRYWAVWAANVKETISLKLRERIIELAKEDVSPNVRIAAAECLVQKNEKAIAIEALIDVMNTDQLRVLSHALHVIENFEFKAPEALLERVSAAQQLNDKILTLASNHILENFKK